MTSLSKLQPVLIVCLVLIIAGIGLEMCGVFYEALSSFGLVCATAVKQICSNLHGKVLRCLVALRQRPKWRVNFLRKKRVAEQRGS